MKIAPRLLLGYASLASLVVVVGCVGYRAVLGVGNHFDRALNRTQPVLSALQDIRFVAARLLIDLEAQQHSLGGSKAPITAAGNDSRTRPSADFSMLDVTLARYQGMVRLYFPEEAATSTSIGQKAHRLKSTAVAFLAIPPGQTRERHEKFDQLRFVLVELLDIVNEATEREYEEFSAYQRDVANEVAAQSNTVILITAASFLAALILGFLLSRRLSRPIVEMRDAAARVGIGHVDARVEVEPSNGELADLAQAFNAMSDRLSRTMVSRDYVSNIVDSMAEALVVVDGAGIIRRYNRAMGALACCPAGAELVGTSLAGMFVESDRLRSLLSEARNGDRIELDMRTSAGGVLQVSLTAASVRGSAADERADTVVLIQDISQRRKHEDRLAYLANYDVLTGLPNRVLTLDLLRQSLSRLPWSARYAVVMLCDLDRFKLVNDTLGHATGDVLLQRVAERLKASVRPGDVVARVSGDEFLLVLNEVGRIEDIGYLAQKFIDELRRPIQIGPNELFVSASIGVCVAPDDGTVAENLLKQADLAMYAAKGAGKNGYRFYSESMSTRSQQRLELEVALRKALLEGDCLLVHYQPQTSIDGTLFGLEALVRWKHPLLGLIAPARFLPMAAEVGLIATIDEKVLSAACRDLRLWRDAGHDDLRIAVNVSDQFFRRADLIEFVQNALDTAGLPPDALELELTESVIMDDIEQAVATLKRLRELGVSLSIDDFGTGYSSLAQLKRCPIRLLKIDRSFITNLAGNRGDAAITEAIVALSHKFGIDVLAEGVETPEQLAMLKACGCDAIQGYLMSPPVAASAVPALIATLRDRADVGLQASLT